MVEPGAEELDNASATVKLYSCGVPRLCGNQRAGTPSGIVNVAERNVVVFVDTGIGSTDRGPEVTLSSGIVIVSVG